MEETQCVSFMLSYVSYPVFLGLAFVLLGMQVKGIVQQIRLFSEEVLCWIIKLS